MSCELYVDDVISARNRELDQPTRTAGTFSGSASVTVHDAVDGEIPLSGFITLASLTESGGLTFYFGSPNAGTTWRFTGQLNGMTITGRHVLANPLIATYSGPWTANRRGVATQSAAPALSHRVLGQLLER